MSFLPFAIIQPKLQIETNIYPINNRFREKSLITTAGGIFGNNPYFCDSFAIVKLAYLPTLPVIGARTECLSFLELRANVYIPITKRFITKNAYDYPGGYQVKLKNIVSTFDGWNIEVGKYFSYRILYDLYFSIAPYFLFGKGYEIGNFELF